MLLVISCALASSAHAARHDGRGKPHAHGNPRATGSYYIRSVHPAVLRRMGCRAGARRANGIVILDFGRLYYDGHSYGTQTFTRPDRAQPRHEQLLAARAEHVPGGPPLGARDRGLRDVPPPRRADEPDPDGAADDAEPAWNPAFIRTRDFFRGYRDYHPGYTLFNYGSLDGGVGTYWNVRQAWFVADRALMRALPRWLQRHVGHLPALTNIHAQ